MDRMKACTSAAPRPHEPGFFDDDLGHLRCDGANRGRNKESATLIWSDAVVYATPNAHPKHGVGSPRFESRSEHHRD